jgi:hypothetical protein
MSNTHISKDTRTYSADKFLMFKTIHDTSYEMFVLLCIVLILYTFYVYDLFHILVSFC